MVKKRISVALVVLMLVVQCAYSIGFSMKATAAGIENDRDIITSVSMAVYGPDGQTVTGSVYDVGSSVKLDYTWALPNGHGYVDGDTFAFQLPAQFELFNDINGSLVSDDGEVGSFTVSQSTHQVLMTFNSYIETHDNVQGTLSINTQFDKKVISGSTVQEIVFPVNGGTQTIVVNFKPSVGSTIEKKGVSGGFNADHIDWTVDVNKKLERVAGAVVTDPIPEGLALDSTVTLAVYALGVQLDGTVTVGALLDSSKYTAEVTDGTLKVHFTDPAITGAYRIAYTTAVVSDTRSSFTNTASFAGDGREPVSSSATVTIERGGSLNKLATNYEWGKQVISWAIEYNYNNKAIPQGSGVLTDLFNNSQELVPGSVKVYPVTLNSSGTAVKGTALSENVDYTVTEATGQGKKGFKLEFLHDISSAFRIEYKTKSADRVLTDTTITNTVSDSTYSVEASQLIRSAIIYKNLSGVDYKNHTTDWKITLNGDGYPMNDVVVTDTFPQGGQKFIPESVVVRNASGTVLGASAYTLEYNSPVKPNAGFKVKFTSPVSGTHTIAYRTEFSNDWLYGNTDNFVNNARIDWVGNDGKAQWTEAKGLFIPRAEVKNNGFKAGAYNARYKLFAWTLGINYNSKVIADPVITDILTSGQIMADGSLRVYNMNIDANGEPSRGSEIPKNAYTYTVGTGNELKVTFKDAISSPYYVVFNTTMQGQLIGPKVDNTAKLLDGTRKVSKDLFASVNIPYGGEYVYKNGVQNGDKLDWKIAINRSQSTIKNAVLTDIPSRNQILLPDSFRLYPAYAETNGELIKGGPELVRDSDYTLRVITDEGGKQSFVLSFLHDISYAHILEYKSLIVANTGEKLVNTVNLTGTNVERVTQETTKEIIVGVSSGSGTGSGVRGTLAVQKLDAADSGLPLAGATFELYRLNGSERVLINTRTTDAAGSAVFNNIWLGSYVLIETAAPAGYALDTREYPVTIGSSATINLTVLNTKLAPATATPTPTPTPTATPSTTPTGSPGATATPSTTPSESPAATTTPSESPAVTPSPAPTSGPTAAPTSTDVPFIPAPTPAASSVPGVIIDEPQIPAGPAVTPAATAAASPSPSASPAAGGNTDEETPIDDEVPLGGVTVDEEEVPKGTAVNPATDGKLPQTGESSPMPIYMAGLALVLAGFILSRVFRNRKE
ncbi:LPXTG cell wall anchor domain-containing protein [Paenibacillus sonchi]|uniref:LPXTG cell wall anchor domain-containing protein n=2 Tax=Paenibacillus sonchi TaxID=373687 RepID=UPI001E5A074E|nr:LPXTG cell wall anchor domain-containing protein [Paenibacillus sonchi]MCE3201995.1 LPXTG cell wall anchor domain-containing protein [Paenibacillus sonchi]